MTAYSAGILSGSLGKDGRLNSYPYSFASRNHVAKIQPISSVIWKAQRQATDGLPGSASRDSRLLRPAGGALSANPFGASG